MGMKTIELTQVEMEHMALLGIMWINAAKETDDQEELKLANNFCRKLLLSMGSSDESKMLAGSLQGTGDQKIIL